jgi:hypothetical protein
MEDKHEESEQGSGLNGYPRHASCGSGAAPRASIGDRGPSVKKYENT